jgi:hypothetical protein
LLERVLAGQRPSQNERGRSCIRLILAALGAALIAASTAEARHYTVQATCYAQAGITASGQETRAGIVANDFLALGTHIRLDESVFGRREIGFRTLR